MEHYIRKIGLTSLITSVLLIIIGLLMAIQPISFMSTAFLMFGVALIIDGVIHCFSYFTIQDEYRYFSYELAQGVIGTILGFIIIMNNENMTVLLPILLGIYIVLDGIFRLQIALNIRGVRNTNWGVMLLLSMVTIAIGFGVIFNPSESIEIVLKLSGSIIIMTQLMNIYDSFYILFEVKEIKKSATKNVKSTKTKK